MCSMIESISSSEIFGHIMLRRKIDINLFAQLGRLYTALTNLKGVGTHFVSRRNSDFVVTRQKSPDFR